MRAKLLSAFHPDKLFLVQAEGQRRRLHLLERARQRGGQDHFPEVSDAAAPLPAVKRNSQDLEEQAQPFSLFPAATSEENPEVGAQQPAFRKAFCCAVRCWKPLMPSPCLQVVEEKRHESRARGSEATRTSDPKFDAAFKFAHTLGGKQVLIFCTCILYHQKARKAATGANKLELGAAADSCLPLLCWHRRLLWEIPSHQDLPCLHT